MQELVLSWDLRAMAWLWQLRRFAASFRWEAGHVVSDIHAKGTCQLVKC